MGVDPKACIVVEDSAADVSAALSAGMRAASSAAVTRRASWPDHLHSLGASAVISDVRALKTAIVELRGW
jgi:beta-phosphoglucomutase-like phosphatase (HAD superfamily)